NLAEAHTSLGNALISNAQLQLAEQEFRRALELNPNYATAHQWLAECLQGQGRFPESLAENERAHELDPLSLIINASYASSLSGVGRYHDAVKQARKARLLEQSFVERDILLQGLFGSIKIDKRLDPLRNDPRFQKLIERFDSGILE